MKRLLQTSILMTVAIPGILGGGVSRTRSYPDAFDPDQLHDPTSSRGELGNVAAAPNHRRQSQLMQSMRRQKLAKFARRPFGEFIPKGNSVPGNQQQYLSPLLKEFAAQSKQCIQIRRIRLLAIQTRTSSPFTNS